MIDKFEENAYLVSNEDSHKANEVKNWTVEQYYTSLVQLEAKIQRFKQARDNMK